MESHVGRAGGRDGLEVHLDSARPVVSLQPVQPAAFLKVGDEHDPARTDVLALFVGIGEGLRGSDERVAQVRGCPARLGRGETLRGQRRARAGVHGGPIFKAEQRTRLLIEREEGDPVGRGRLSQNFFRFGDCLLPEILASHAGAGIHEQNDLVAGAGLRIGNHRFL